MLTPEIVSLPRGLVPGSLWAGRRQRVYVGSDVTEDGNAIREIWIREGEFMMIVSCEGWMDEMNGEMFRATFLLNERVYRDWTWDIWSWHRDFVWVK